MVILLLFFRLISKAFLREKVSKISNKTDIDDAINYRYKHLGDEYFTVVALNGTFQDWRDFATISTYTVGWTYFQPKYLEHEKIAL